MQVLVEQNATTTDGRFCSNYISTIKLVHVVTSIKQSPVLKGHLFSYPVIENFI